MSKQQQDIIEMSATIIPLKEGYPLQMMEAKITMPTNKPKSYKVLAKEIARLISLPFGVLLGVGTLAVALTASAVVDLLSGRT